MTFKEFANKLGSVIRAGNSTSSFARTLFESIIPEDKTDVLDEYKQSSFKAYYNGNSQITRIAHKVYPYAQEENFEEYINQFEGSTAQKICDAFSNIIPGINSCNVGSKLGELFISIIREAAKDVREGQTIDKEDELPRRLAIITDGANVSPDISEFRDGVFYVTDNSVVDKTDLFQKYLTNAVDYYSAKKTLLYAEKPHPFYQLYVCNDIMYHKQSFTGMSDSRPTITISNGTIEKLERETRYIIIEGTGGIGKSMYMTHLFLSSAEEYKISGKLPILITLRNYREGMTDIVDLAWVAVDEYDATVTKNDIIALLESKKAILLMDGLDEIQTSAEDTFNKDLESFIKSYPGNTIIMTSRPINSFISYSKFTLFDIEPLSKEQALDLVRKLDFWDEKCKKEFIKALDDKLYFSHWQFASNPLLLTIMLMTFSTFGEVPAKMHVFYSKAYETMARLHDASKGSYQRPLHTGLTPEEFAKYFAQFCARTYTDEVLDFNELTFSSYMNKVIKLMPSRENLNANDFLLDLTDNLCIMYYEGQEYHFIHRSFQEYFAAVYFASDYDEKLKKVGRYFEKQVRRSLSDRTFDMLYDMVPDKIERFIFLPFLEQLFNECEDNGANEYWQFLQKTYPFLYKNIGEIGAIYYNESVSFTYKFIVDNKKLSQYTELDSLDWPKLLDDFPTINWVSAYSNFLTNEAFEPYSSADGIDDSLLGATETVDKDELPYLYARYFDDPEIVGHTTEIDIELLVKHPSLNKSIMAFMESEKFPLRQEFINVKSYYEKLSAKKAKETASNSLFDD